MPLSEELKFNMTTFCNKLTEFSTPSTNKKYASSHNNDKLKTYYWTSIKSKDVLNFINTCPVLFNPTKVGTKYFVRTGERFPINADVVQSKEIISHGHLWQQSNVFSFKTCHSYSEKRKQLLHATAARDIKSS